jgi:YesN/AraC family two-component response regulator
LIDQARKTIEETKKEKNETQLVRRVLNQITPDNYELKKDQLRKLLFEERKTFEELCKEQPKMTAEEKNTLKKEIENSNIDSEKETIVVATIFRKAANEKLFVGFYASLCSDIVRLEL